jgi:hypothetical protein
VRHHIDERVRIAVDSTDVLQELGLVAVSIKFPEEVLSSPQAFVSYLAKAAENLARKTNRSLLHTQKRSLLRQQPLNALGPDNEPSCAADDTAGALDLEESLDALQDSFAPVYRQILQWTRAGRSAEEISAELSRAQVPMSANMVHRILKRIATIVAQRQSCAGCDW